MATGYTIAGGADIDTLFLAGTNGGTTGYKKAGGADVGAQFNTYVSGTKRAATGYKNSSGTDFSDLFQNSAVPLPPAVYNPFLGMDTLYSDYSNDQDSYTYLYVNRDGSWSVNMTSSGSDSSNWAQTPVFNVGDNVYVKFTVTAVTRVGAGGSYTGTTSPVLLTTNRFISVYAAGDGVTDVSYRIELCTNADGSGVISTTNVRLNAEAVFN